MKYDLGADPDIFMLTHARAFSEHRAFDLVAGVDTNEQARLVFSEHYAAPAYEDIVMALETHQPQIVVIAVPPGQHLEMIQTVLHYSSTLAILCEKPMSGELKDAKRIVRLCQERGVQLYVNYIRRSDPGVLELSRRFREEKIVMPVKGICWYSKGLFNNGSHFLNLLANWLGQTQSVEVHARGRLWDEHDPEPDFSVNFEKGRITFLAAREECFSHYAIELLAENGRLRYEQSGNRIAWQQAVSDPVYHGYTILDDTEELIPADMDKAQWHVVNQLNMAIEGQHADICNGQDALRTLELMSEIKSIR